MTGAQLQKILHALLVVIFTDKKDFSDMKKVSNMTY